MTRPLEEINLDSAMPHATWVADAAKDAHEPGSSVLDFAKRNWKEIAGIGVIAAGTAFIAYGGASKLELLGSLFSRGETAAVTADRIGAAGELSKDVVSRLANVDHFVFDMDRTLLDHDAALKALQSTMTDGLVARSGLSREFIANALEDTTKRLDSPYFWNRLDEIKPLQEAFPGVNLNEHFADVAAQSKTAFYDALKAKPETVELLSYLKDQGKSVHVFTAGNPARALEKLTGSGLINHVDNIYTSGINAFEDSQASGLLTREGTGANLISLPDRAKGTGDGYQMILDHLKSGARKVAMTGDHPIEDVAHSKALGIFASQAKWYRSVPAESVLPDLELTSPGQFTDILKTVQRAKIA